MVSPATAKKVVQNNGMLKKSSFLESIEATKKVPINFLVWSTKAPALTEDPKRLFVKCLVVAGSDEKVLKCRQIDPPDPSQEVFDVSPQDVYNLNKDLDVTSFSDLGLIPYSNAPCVLDFLKERYIKNIIYSTAEPLMVAVNPYRDLGNTTSKVICQYRDASDISKLPPHVFSVARLALENLHSVQKSQTIVVSGESGAGKTETTKHFMQYFAAAKSTDADFRIQKAVMAANPVLEAFGNAKTLRNDNSSRFGRFMQLSTARSGGILNGSIRNFLLEKSRVVGQDDEERSYHIFYQLLKGADSKMKKKFGLKSVEEYSFLQSNCHSVPGVDDTEEFKEVKSALDYMGMTPEETEDVFSIVAGVLTLGNVKIHGVHKQGTHNAAELSEESKDTLTHACRLLHIEPSLVEEGITQKITIAGGQTIKSVWSDVESKVLLESLAKAIYERLFFWIVKKLNKVISSPKPLTPFMGMLDIFGFEVFPNNSLEQLLINITNEMLQKSFVDIVFQKEHRLYKDEGISDYDLKWTTNIDLIEMLTTRKKASLMGSLEDQCLTASGTTEAFVTNLIDTLSSTGKVKSPKISAGNNFIIVHSVGDVVYQATHFIEKNKDILRPELAAVVMESQNDVSKELFAGVSIARGKLAKGQLISSQFLSSLEELMGLINSTETHYIRCVKPNDEKKPLMFTNSIVIVQLKALSILEALQLRNLGYSYRRPFKEFLTQFRDVDYSVASDTSLSPKEAAVKFMESTKLDEWRLGKTMIFMRPQTVKQLTYLLRLRMSAWETLVTQIEALYQFQTSLESVLTTQSGLIRFQSHVVRVLRAVN